MRGCFFIDTLFEIACLVLLALGVAHDIGAAVRRIGGRDDFE